MRVRVRKGSSPSSSFDLVALFQNEKLGTALSKRHRSLMFSLQVSGSTGYQVFVLTSLDPQDTRFLV